MKRREFFKNVGNVGAFGAGAMALGMMASCTLIRSSRCTCQLYSRMYAGYVVTEDANLTACVSTLTNDDLRL